jgi:dTDP-4-amino-4,6-dideoxygalactose transaminase
MIPFNQPYVSLNAQWYIDEALGSSIQQGDGNFSCLCSEFIQKMYAEYKCLLVPSYTSAIELSFILLNLKFCY